VSDGPEGAPGPPSDEGPPADTISWRELLVEATEALTGVAGIEAPEREARWICEEASGLEGAEWVVGCEAPATVRGVAHLDAMVARRRAGEPIQYVLGHWSFRTLDLLVDARVLIPRPETEQVVEVALAELDRVLLGRPAGHRPVAADLGTGSGAIALSLVAERPGVEVWATDRSADAGAVARANVAGLGRDGTRVRVAQGDWFAALPDELRGALDLVVSNPPYVAAGEQLDPSVADWEPAGALVPGPTGLEDYEVLVPEAAEWLAPGGVLVLEIGATQGDAVRALAEAAGFVDVRVEPDLAGLDRAVVARRP
jgi:release factor glutamine methyltransferase